MNLLKKLRSGGGNKAPTAERVVASTSTSGKSTSSPALEELPEEDFEAGVGNVSTSSTMTTMELNVVRALLIYQWGRCL